MHIFPIAPVLSYPPPPHRAQQLRTIRVALSHALHIVACGAAKGVPFRGEQRRDCMGHLDGTELLASRREVDVVPELQVAGFVGLAAHRRDCRVQIDHFDIRLAAEQRQCRRVVVICIQQSNVHQPVTHHLKASAGCEKQLSCSMRRRTDARVEVRAAAATSESLRGSADGRHRSGGDPEDLTARRQGCVRSFVDGA